MKRGILIVCSVCSLLLLSGCWNKFELTEWGFVQAVAIDLSEEGKIKLKTHIYKPGGGNPMEQPKGGSAYINISTEANSIFEAIRDIPLYLGRKAQWSHMRIILISKQTAKKLNIMDLTDFFLRDHEPRESTSVMITEGQASDLLEIKPYIEHTMGQQMRKTEKAAAHFSSKSIFVTLLDLAMESKSDVKTFYLPYARIMKNSTKSVAFAGVAILKKGKIIDDIPSEHVKSLLMLVNKFEGGITEIPCSESGKGNKKIQETIEDGAVKTKIKTVIQGDDLFFHVSAKIEGDVGELHCSSVVTSEEETKFAKKVAATIEDQMRSTIELLQKKKSDVIGIGDQIHRHHPKLWEKWKTNWEERFAESRFDIHVDVTIHSVGMKIGKPST